MPPKKRSRSPSRSPSPRRNATASTSTARPPTTPSPSRSHRDGSGKLILSFPRLKGRRSQNNTRGRHSSNTPPLPSSLPATTSSSTAVSPPAGPTQPPESSTKVVATIIWDGVTEALKVAKESSDWLPVLKAVLGGAVAVIEIGKQFIGNSEEMKSLVNRIKNLQPILKIRINNYRPGGNLSASHVEDFARTFEGAVAEVKEMQTHGTFRRIIQSTRDKDRLLGVYRRIKDTLDDLQYTVGLSIEHDTSIIRQSVALKDLPISVTAPYNAAIDQTTVPRQSCTKNTRLSILKLILHWISEPESAPVYWLTGPAGVGKTTIAHTICKYVVSPTGEHEHEASSQDLRKRRLVSCFCSHQLNSGEAKRLVPTLCRRLAEHSSSYARELVRVLEEDSTLANAELPDQLEGLLVKPWQLSAAQREGLPSPIVVVDALDENTGGFKFLDLLLKAVDKLDGLLFLLTSRTHPEIAERCQSFPKDAVCRLQDVPEEDVQSDITLYLEASLPKVNNELRRDLAARAGNLFIYAATVVKMTRRHTGSEQEMRIGKILGQTPAGESQILEGLYASIVEDVISDTDQDIQRGRLHVLHTILSTLFCWYGGRQHRQITVRDSRLITQLNGVHEDVFPVILDGLHAVMYTAKDGSILTYHASFPDFILRPPSSFSSSEYSNPLCDEGLHHAHLTRRCYEIMAERLHFNMFNLESSFDMNKDISDLPSRVKANIDPVLEYAVRYWMNHLEKSCPDEDTLNSIPLCDIPLAFIDNLLLYWLEVVTLIPERISLSDTIQWIEKHCPEHRNIWNEVGWFCEVFNEMPQPSTPHSYLSILSLWKPESHISQMWRPRFPHLPNVALDGQRNPPDVTWRQFGPLSSKGYTYDGTLGDGNELVGVSPLQLDRETGWALSDNGCRIMWLPHRQNNFLRFFTLQAYMVLPEPDQISFDLEYLGRNWTRIYEPPSSQ